MDDTRSFPIQAGTAYRNDEGRVVSPKSSRRKDSKGKSSAC